MPLVGTPHGRALAAQAVEVIEWGQRSVPLSLAAEIQHRLLPGAFTCEAGQFTLAAWLQPAGEIGGDTFGGGTRPRSSGPQSQRRSATRRCHGAVSRLARRPAARPRCQFGS